MISADSLVVTTFCARLRARADLPPISTKDVYQRPTIRSLAAALDRFRPGDLCSSGISPGTRQSGARRCFAAFPVRSAAIAECGWILLSRCARLNSGLQLDIRGFGFRRYLYRAILASGAGFLGMCILPILAKWTLIGRWKPEQFRVWSLKYFRFWLVKTLVRYNPLVLFAGSPIFTFYLRALGAKIGRDVLILSPQVPACTDLLTVGDNTVICKDSFFSCYSARRRPDLYGPGYHWEKCICW